jgi:hypothetical protein
MILDPLKPYLAAIRIAGYIAIIGFLIISSCNYGKRGEAVRADKLETALGVCKDANANNVATIKTLTDANAEYASQGAKQADDVAKAQKDLKAAQRAIQAQEKAKEKELQNAYKKNPDWSSQPVPADVVRVFDRADQN